MTTHFSGRTAIVTGAAIGIGFEIARQLAAQGASVILNDVDGDALAEAVATLRASDLACAAVVGSASSIACIDEMVATAVEQFGRLDFAIANAGITTFGDFLSYDVAQFEQIVAVNLQGSFFLAQRAARQLIKQQSGGRIILMSSVTGLQYHPDLAAYGMSKAAIRMLAKSLGVELAPYGITVNAIAPGATVTERTSEDVNYSAEWSNLTPTGRPATTEDIAATALFLLSSGASQITGQTIVVDGGWTSVSPPPASD